MVSFIIITVAFLACQSCISPNVDNESIASPPPTNVRSPSVSENYQEQEEKYHSMQNELRKASAKLGVDNLIDSVRDKEHEIRIWVGFGLTYPRCFILRNLNREPKASYRTLMTVRQKTNVGEEVEAKTTNTDLGIPKSGWAELQRFLKSQGIESPIQLRRETGYTPDPDEQIIAIEVRSGTEYSMVFYHLDNKSADAEKALSVCRKIEDEFSIALHCSPQ